MRLTGLRTDREVILGGDVQNAGTIVIEADAPNTENSLRLVTRNFYSLEGSSLVARMPLSLIISATKIINRGAVDFHATVDGAAAASLRFKAKELWSTGPFDFRGAASVAASGGAGGGLDVTANVIAIRSEIDCSGGSGRTGGGAAGSVWVEAASALTRLSGRMLIRGGSCSGEGCVAGDGNRVIVYSCGALLVNADIDTSGGDGVEAGGHGGEIALKDLPVSLALAAGSIEVSGNVVSSGGRGRQGGNAGPVTVEVNPVNDALGQEITLIGYESIVANGGNSVTGTGGDGAWIALLNAPSWRGNVEIGPTGAIINEADLPFHGGDGAVGRFGGSVTFGAFARSTEVGSFLSDGESIHNSGALDGVGGTGTAQSGGGGSVGFASPGDIENLGTIALSGGGTMQRCEVGGPGGGLGLSSPGGSVTSTGAIHVEGGAGRRSAGNGGGAAFFGVFVSNAATITAGGGESLERGGAGGEVSFWSTGVQQAVIGLVDSRGGAGATPGQTGRVEINGSILNR